jgi:2-hydroxyglutarate dehydrogenase
VPLSGWKKKVEIVKKVSYSLVVISFSFVVWFQVPDPRFPFLGVHFTPRMDGSVWLGPNAVLAFKREGYSWFDFDIKDFWDTIQYRGFQKLAMKYVGFGMGEMLRSAIPNLQLAALQEFIPDIAPTDVTR